MAKRGNLTGSWAGRGWHGLRWWQLGLMAALALLPLLPLTVGIRYEHEGGPDRLTVWARLLGVLRLEYAIQPEGGQLGEDLLARLLAGSPREWFTSLRTKLDQWGRFSEAARYLMAATVVQRLTIALELGTGDAALTGLTIGALWSLFGAARGLATRSLRFAPGQPQLLVTPRFDRAALRLRLSCILTLRVGHIIVAGSKLLQVRAKGVSSWWVSTPSRG